MSKFFKSDWFKCTIVLLVLATLLGGLLAVLSDVLYVTPDERTNRAVKKIYGTNMVVSKVELDVDSTADGVEKSALEIKILDSVSGQEKAIGCINKIYYIGDSTTNSYDMLFQSTGYEGYKNGTITVWVQVTLNEGVYSIEKVVMESYTKQTLMSKLGADYYDTFMLTDVTKAYKEGKAFTTQSGQGEFTNPVSQATYSANAGNNAVNCIIQYLGGKA